MPSCDFNKVKFILANFVFVGSGITQSLQVFQLDLSGLTEHTENGMAAAGNVMGSTLILMWFPSIWKQITWVQAKKLFIVALFDLGGAICTAVSIDTIGSGIFTVIYSFIAVFIAIVNRACLRKGLSPVRWIGLLVITMFVMVSSLGQLQGSDKDPDSENNPSTIVGIVAALGATVSYGLMYIWLNHLYENEVISDPQVTCLTVASMEVAMFGIYSLVYVIPNWEALVVIPIEDAALNWGTVFTFGYLLLYYLVSGCHQIAFYECLNFGPAAATSSAVAKSLQAVLLFFFSHLFFCSQAAVQCINDFKVLGTFGVAFGILVYAFDEHISNCISRLNGESKLNDHRRMEVEDSRSSQAEAVFATTINSPMQNFAGDLNSPLVNRL